MRPIGKFDENQLRHHSRGPVNGTRASAAPRNSNPKAKNQKPKTKKHAAIAASFLFRYRISLHSTTIKRELTRRKYPGRDALARCATPAEQRLPPSSDSRASYHAWLSSGARPDRALGADGAPTRHHRLKSPGENHRS